MPHPNPTIRARARANKDRTDGTYCHRCGDRLDENAATWLVLSGSDGRFYSTAAEADATGSNQGGFPFGLRCAAAELRDTAAELRHANTTRTTSMPATRQIDVDHEVYTHITTNARPGETTSDTIRRLIAERTPSPTPEPEA